MGFYLKQSFNLVKTVGILFENVSICFYFLLIYFIYQIVVTSCRIFEIFVKVSMPQNSISIIISHSFPVVHTFVSISYFHLYVINSSDFSRYVNNCSFLIANDYLFDI